jgi:hypothetical protein
MSTAIIVTSPPWLDCPSSLSVMGVVGPSVRRFYMRGLGRKVYNRNLNLRLVAAFIYRRPR